jgi:hypothetical protein
METIELVGKVFFNGAWFVAIASWLYGLYEMVNMNRLNPSAFKRGITILDKSDVIPIDSTKVTAGQIQTGRIGKFKFINSKECLFCPRYRFFTWRTPLPIKGRIQWHQGVAKIEGRIPLSTTILLVAWFVGCATAGLMSASSGIMFSLGLAVLGGSIAAVIFLASIPIELRRTQAIVQDIKEYLEKDCPRTLP